MTTGDYTNKIQKQEDKISRHFRLVDGIYAKGL